MKFLIYDCEVLQFYPKFNEEDFYNCDYTKNY